MYQPFKLQPHKKNYNKYMRTPYLSSKTNPKLTKRLNPTRKDNKKKTSTSPLGLTFFFCPVHATEAVTMIQLCAALEGLMIPTTDHHNRKKKKLAVLDQHKREGLLPAHRQNEQSLPIIRQYLPGTITNAVPWITPIQSTQSIPS